MRGWMLRLGVLCSLLGASTAVADGPFDDYGQRATAHELRELQLWHRGLPAVGQSGQAFIGCSSRNNATDAQFNEHFEICWTRPNNYGSCSHRCGANYHVFSFWAPNPSSRSRIDYVIFCRCNQIRHQYRRYPVPSILHATGIAH